MSVTKPTVLIAEDDPQLRELYSLILKTEGFSVIEAEDGEQALSFACAHRPDLVILDIMMPKMDGLSVLSNIRKDKDVSKTPVIILSALQNERNKKEAEQNGALGYLVKSESGVKEIVDTVKKILKKNT